MDEEVASSPKAPRKRTKKAAKKSEESPQKKRPAPEKASPVAKMKKKEEEAPPADEVYTFVLDSEHTQGNGNNSDVRCISI